jgi:hypothetical protein
MSRGTLHLLIFVLVGWFAYIHFVKKVPFKN